MKTLILASQRSENLSFLTTKTCASLLPIAGRPLVEYTLDALVETEIEEATIFVADFSQRVEEALGDGSAWGLELEYVKISGEESLAELIERDGMDRDEPVLILRTDRLCNRLDALRRFLEEVEKTPLAMRIDGHANGCALGFCWLRSPRIECLDEVPTIVELPELSCQVVDSVASYHRLNLEVAAGACEALEFRTREITPGVRVGLHSSLPGDAVRGSGVLVGQHCQIDGRAAVGPRVVVQSEVLIDRHAQLEDCVVLPGTFIGEGMTLRRAIVWGDTILQLSDADDPRAAFEVIRVEDSSRLADLGTNPIAAMVGDLIGRSHRAAMALVAWPLWTRPLSAEAVWRWARPSRSDLHQPSA